MVRFPALSAIPVPVYTRGLFWVSPAGRLAELFDKLHNLEDPAEVVRLSALYDVNFLPPGSVEGA